jgi:hypothetical protein
MYIYERIFLESIYTFIISVFCLCPGPRTRKKKVESCSNLITKNYSII